MTRRPPRSTRTDTLFPSTPPFRSPALLEELAEARFRAGMLGARDGVAGNELDAVGQVGADIADHRRLHRSDIGDDGTSLDLRSCLGRERRVRADRNAEDHQVGALQGLGGTTVERGGVWQTGVWGKRV